MVRNLTLDARHDATICDEKGFGTFTGPRKNYSKFSEEFESDQGTDEVLYTRNPLAYFV